MTELNEASLPLTNFNDDRSIQGILTALIVIGLWAGSLIFLLSLDFQLPIVWLILAIAARTFLYTGLFITAHDAMHGSLYPQNPKINHFIGSLAVFLYALFPYQKLQRNHRAHHRHPASKDDPDFHDSQHQNFLFWYFNFVKKYCGLWQLLGLSASFNLLEHTLVSSNNLFLFWVIPSLLSSVQLFYFGVFLPHREPEGGYTNSYRAKSNSLSTFWSFIACYHFGYHEEHHQYPHVPWWQLPLVHQRQTALTALTPDTAQYRKNE